MRIPFALGSLDDPEVIDDLIEDFYEKTGREPACAEELLRWHRKNINKAIKSIGFEITERNEVRELSCGRDREAEAQS